MMVYVTSQLTSYVSFNHTARGSSRTSMDDFAIFMKRTLLNINEYHRNIRVLLLTYVTYSNVYNHI